MRERLKGSYSETGRLSIDPELLLRILLIGYRYGITSEHQLMEPQTRRRAWSGVTYRNLSTSETSFVSWVFPNPGGIRCPSYVYFALAHVHC